MTGFEDMMPVVDEAYKKGFEAVKNKIPVPHHTMKQIPFEHIKIEDQIVINDIAIFNGFLFIATDKGIYEYDETMEIFRPITLEK